MPSPEIVPYRAICEADFTNRGASTMKYRVTLNWFDEEGQPQQVAIGEFDCIYRARGYAKMELDEQLEACNRLQRDMDCHVEIYPTDPKDNSVYEVYPKEPHQPDHATQTGMYDR